MPKDRDGNRAARDVTLDPAIAKEASAAKFPGRARTGKQSAEAFADAASMSLPGDGQTRFRYGGAEALFRDRQNRNEAYRHVRSIIPARIDCARQLWESAGSAKRSSDIGCGLGRSGGLPEARYFANMVSARNSAP